MAGRGYIKMHREVMDHPIFSHAGMFRLWCYLLLRANWREAAWLIPGTTDKVMVARGQLITGRETLLVSLYGASTKGVDVPSSRTVWRWLEALRDMDCIVVRNVSNRCSLVTICNYETYQGDDSDQCPTNVLPVSDQCPADVLPVSTNKETKKLRTLLVAEPRLAADGSGDGKPATLKATKAPKAYPEAFEAFWQAYPPRGGRRRGKDGTFALWQQVQDVDQPALLEAARQFAKSDDAVRGFARDPERFLKKHWWREWIPALPIRSAPAVAAPHEVLRQIKPVKWETV